jgi:uncharacterized protein (TIGR03067 family)
MHEARMLKNVTIAIGVGFVGVALVLAQDTAGDAKRLQGVWEPVAVTAEGKKIAEADVAKSGMRLTMDGDRYKVTVQGKLVEGGTFKLDPGKSPRTLDLTITEGDDKGKTQLGIYKLDGEALTIALPPTGTTARPAAFESTAKNQVELTTFRRAR